MWEQIFSLPRSQHRAPCFPSRYCSRTDALCKLSLLLSAGAAQGKGGLEAWGGGQEARPGNPLLWTKEGPIASQLRRGPQGLHTVSPSDHSFVRAVGAPHSRLGLPGGQVLSLIAPGCQIGPLPPTQTGAHGRTWAPLLPEKACFSHLQPPHPQSLLRDLWQSWKRSCPPMGLGDPPPHPRGH